MKTKVKSIICLVINLIIVICTIVSVLLMADIGAKGNMAGVGTQVFRYYTTDSNILLAIICAITIPFNIKEIKGKEITIPEWLKILRLMGVVCISITFLVVVAFLGPTIGYLKMIEGENFILHISNPIIAGVSFIVFEEDYKIKFAKSFFTLIPTAIYGVVYMIMVIFIGKENGGWSDFYHFNSSGMWYLAFSIILLAVLLNFVYIKLNSLKSKKK